ncbi:MAG: hypothetical protein DMG96_16805 [Acidobacteria bacterium]|nr:MAG: hypothetical protein DMG96_16805 [Acidobacteriota bacterium]
MNPKEISLTISFLLPCAPAPATATLTLPVAQAPLRFPDDKPEPTHPPHGEGSGELPSLTGISASGAMANVNAIVTTTTWEPVTGAYPGPAHDFFAKPAHQHMYKVALVTPRRFLPRARRSC